MLVLSRKLNESITIGENVSVKVIRVQGGRVRLAIEAPDHIRISRSEIAFEPATPADPSDSGVYRRTVRTPRSVGPAPA